MFAWFRLKMTPRFPKPVTCSCLANEDISDYRRVSDMQVTQSKLLDSFPCFRYCILWKKIYTKTMHFCTVPINDDKIISLKYFHNYLISMTIPTQSSPLSCDMNNFELVSVVANM